MENVSVIIIGWNEKAEMARCANAIWDANPETHIVFVDNGSVDGTNEWLQEIGVEYVYFDEGIQPYGKAINVVLENFALHDNIIITWPRYQLGRSCIAKMVEALDSGDNVGVVGICASGVKGEQELKLLSETELGEKEEERKDGKVLYTIGCQGFCFGVKKRLVEQVGFFDEQLAYTDVMLDYQLRCIMHGYINRVSQAACAFDWSIKKEYRDCFLLLQNADRDKLRKKWNTNYFMLSPNHKLVEMVEAEEDADFSVLEIGCDMGANLLGIKNKYPNCRIYGLELNPNSAEIGSRVIDIRCGNIEDENVDFGVKFDYIIFGDVLEHLHNPEKTVMYCRHLLNENGRIIASIPNIMHVSIMSELLKGRFHYTDVGLLDRTHIHLFTLKEIVAMFENMGYEMENVIGITYELLKEEEILIKQLMEISGEGVQESMYETYQYLVAAKKCEI